VVQAIDDHLQLLLIAIFQNSVQKFGSIGRIGVTVFNDGTLTPAQPAAPAT
jgi:hypothetical protein